LYDDITDVHAVPSASRSLTPGATAQNARRLAAAARRVDVSTLSEADAAQLQAAIADCEAVLAKNRQRLQEFADAQHGSKIYWKKSASTNRNAKPSVTASRCFLSKLLSDALYRYWGPRGFTDW
jgi:hypothetical protein